MICWVVSGWRRTGRAPLLPWRFAPVPVSRRRKEACSRKSRSMYASSRAMSAQYHLEDVGLVDERHATFLDESEETGRAVEIVDGPARVGRQHVTEEPAQHFAAAKPDVDLVLQRKVDLVAFPGWLVGADDRDRILCKEGDAVPLAIDARHEVRRRFEDVPDALLPVVRDASGQQIADGTLTQWIEDGNLHVTGTYVFKDGRVVEEQTVLSQHPELAQLRWSWEERKGTEVERSYSIDFTTGHAVVHKRGEDVREDHLDDAKQLGRAFAGVGFMYAVKNLVADLEKGGAVELT